MWVRHLYFSYYICVDSGTLFPQEVLLPLCADITPVREIGAISRLRIPGFGQLDGLLLVVCFSSMFSLKSRNSKSSMSYL